MKMNPPTNLAISEHVSNEDAEIVNYSRLFKALWRGKLFIFLAFLVGAMISFVYAYSQYPIYRADSLLRVESQKATIPGIEALGGASPPIYTELIIIKSRKNLGLAVDTLGLEVRAWPKRVPILGNFYRNAINPDSTNKPPKILEEIDAYVQKYAWGNESIILKNFEVPDEYLDQPMTLVAKGDNKFNVFIKDIKAPIVSGEVGLQSSSEDGKIRIHVSELLGQAGSEYNILKRSRLQAIDILNASVNASEGGDKNKGIIKLTLKGENKDLIVAVLSSITETYLSQNKSRSSEEASNALVFLQQQIKPLREKSRKAEEKLKKYRTRNKTANMTLETQAVLDITSSIDADLQKLSIKKDELRQKYTANHPLLLAIVSQEKKLSLRKQRNLAKITKLPDTQQTLLALERNFKVTNSIYQDMSNKIQEFRIAKASGSIGNVYLIDSAAAYKRAVNSSKKKTLLMGPLLGALIATILVLLHKVFVSTKIETPEELEKITKISVLSSIPFSKKVIRTIGYKTDYKRQKHLLALKHKPDVAIEGLRSFRSSMHFALSEAPNNIVVIAGATANTGISFISSNLSALTAAGEKRLLLIDGDLRDGYLHTLLKQKNEIGFAELLSGDAKPDEVITSIPVGYGTMDIITSGKTPQCPSELLMHSNLNKVLPILSKKYDVVIIDTPPIDSFTDAITIGKYAGVVFLVVRSAKQVKSEVLNAVKGLTVSGVKIRGLIFNDYSHK